MFFKEAIKRFTVNEEIDGHIRIKIIEIDLVENKLRVQVLQASYFWLTNGFIIGETFWLVPNGDKFWIIEPTENLPWFLLSIKLDSNKKSFCHYR